MVIQYEHQAKFWCVVITPEQSYVKVFAFSIRRFSSGQKRFKLLYTSNVEVKLIHIFVPGHTSHMEAGLGHTLNTI